jgi:transposase InsO family protein
MCHDYGVIPQAYILSDNGSAFTSAAFTAKLCQLVQIIHFAGAGAHHYNGTAELTIQTSMSMARTMMLHASIHWPEMLDPSLWPMAVAHAVFLYNHVPTLDSGVSPIDLFTKTQWEQRKFHNLHIWGCPVSYILDKTLSDGKKLPRWKP